MRKERDRRIEKRGRDRRNEKRESENGQKKGGTQSMTVEGDEWTLALYNGRRSEGEAPKSGWPFLLIHTPLLS